MFFEHRAFWLPKDIQDTKGYEDAFHVDGRLGQAAVCDGVSSTLFSGRWAGILAKAAVEDTPDIDDLPALQDWLKRYRESWAASVDEASLAWHQKPKMLEGAGSTLLWVQVSGGGTNSGVPLPYQLRGYAIGDCCLFHVRRNQVLQSFPIQDSSRFEEHPQVIRSVFKRSEQVSFEAIETQCNPGDLVVLCSDAVAVWTMRQIEAGITLDWLAYWEMTEQEWQQWLISLREENQIRYDDSTVVLLRIGDEPAPPPIRPIVVEKEDGFLDTAETKFRGALKSLKGSLRKGLREISDSKWLDEDESK